MPSKHISPGANTSSPLFNCPHARKTHFTQCQHVKPPLQLLPRPQRTFHPVPTPQTPFATAPMPSKHISTSANTVVVCFLGTRLHSCASLFLKLRNPKSQSTNLAGSLDGAPIITQSRRHKPCSKIEVSYSAHSQLAFDASLLFTDCQRDCDCDLRFARCCAVALRCCAAAVRSHNTTPPLRPRRGLTHLGGRHNVE